MRKKILITVGIVVVVLVAGVGILLANLGRIVSSKKDYLLSEAREKVGREVTLDEINVALWPSIGVRLSNFAVAEDAAFGEGDFVRAENLFVSVKILPLLKKNVEVKRLILNDPVIRLTRNAEGRFNFETLGVPAATPPPAGPISGTADAGEGGSGTVADDAARTPAATTSAAELPLVLAVADIRNGAVHFRDEMKSVDMTVSRIDISVEDFSLDGEVRIDASAALFSGEKDVSVSGTAGPIGKDQTPEAMARVPLDIEAELTGVAFDSLRRFMPPDAPLEKVDAVSPGTFSAKLGVTGTVGALTLEAVQLDGSLFGAESPNLSVRASGGPVNALEPATITESARLTGEISLERITMSALGALAQPPASGETAAVPQFGGTGTLNAQFETRPGEDNWLMAGVRADLTQTTITLPDVFTKPAGTNCRLQLAIARGASSTSIDGSQAVLDELVVSADGRVDDDGTVDLQIKSNETDVAGWSEMLPQLAEFQMGGKFSFSAAVSGKMDETTKPHVSGSLTVAGASARTPQLPKPVTAINANVQFTAETATIENASLNVGESRVNVSARVTQMQPLRADYEVSIPKLNRADFQKPPKPSPRPEVLENVVAEGRVWAEGEETIKHEGTVRSSGGTIANVDYSNLNASIKGDQKVIVIEKFSANSLDGEIEGAGRIEPDTAAPKFDISTNVKQVNLAEYFRYSFPFLADVIAGRINVDMNLAGAGKEWPDIQKTLQGKGGAIVIEGALLNMNIAQEALAGVQGLPMVPAGFADRVTEKYPKLFTGGKTQFKNLKGEVTIENGRVNTGDLLLEASEFSIAGRGWFSFDRKMDMSTTVVLSQRLTQDVVKELEIAKYLRNAQGRIEVPLIFRGNVMKPTIVPDTDAITRRLQSAAVESARDKLQDEVKDQLGDKVKDLFGGFGKKKTAPKDTTKTN